MPQERGRRVALPCPQHHTREQGRLSHAHIPRVRSPETPALGRVRVRVRGKGDSPEDCSWLGAGSALLISCPQGQLPQVQVRGGASSHSPQTTRPQVAAQTRDISQALVIDPGCCRATRVPRPLWQHRSGPHHGPRWHLQPLLTTLRFCLSSLRPRLSVSLSLPFFSTTYLLLLVAPGSLSV